MVKWEGDVVLLHIIQTSEEMRMQVSCFLIEAFVLVEAQKDQMPAFFFLFDFQIVSLKD